MNGQGSPSPRIALGAWSFPQLLIGGLLLAMCASVSGATHGTRLRLQIVWGGQDARLWRGSIRIDDGSISFVQVLGLDADQPGSYVSDLDGRRIRVEPRYARSYSGMEVLVEGSRESELEISLYPDLDASAPEVFVYPLAELREGEHKESPGGDQKLRIARPVGDDLRVRLNHDNMVFEPGERIRLDVLPHELDVRPSSTLRGRLRVRSAEDRRNEVAEFLNQSDDHLWSRNMAVKIDESGTAQPVTGIEVPVPDAEGVYDLTIELANQLPKVGLLTKRKLQFVVIDSRRPPLYGGGDPTLVSQFNPAKPDWTELLAQLPQWRFIPRSKRGPWSNLPWTEWQYQGKSWTRLSEQGWIACSLPVNDVGLPHILEIEFPPKLVQEVGVSILEPDGSGMPVSLDSGVAVGDPDLMVPNDSSPPTITRHRLVFWPKTTSPVVVISNRMPKGTVAFGELRLEVFKQGLPVVTSTTEGKRKRIAVIDGNDFKNTFLARSAFNDDTKVSYDDWRTFYDAGSRLVAYLRYAGYDGATLRAVGDGSSLYPSDLLNPTPAFDRGVFANTGQDPFRKDVLEMLFRMFDREGLVLIPGIEFATPLPKLEEQLARGVKGLEIVDVHRRLGANLQKQIPGKAPYYNPLDPRVQLEMENVVQEILDRYAAHASFKGVNLRLVDVGFTQLPDVGWPFDTQTLARFHNHFPGAGGTQDAATRSQQLREQLINRSSTPLTRAWLEWRSRELADFYRRMGKLVVQAEADARLYISLVDLSNSTPWQRHLRPALPRKAAAADAMHDLGLDPQLLTTQQAIVLLRPKRIAPITFLASQAINLEGMEQEVQHVFASELHAASEFLHESHRHTMADFGQRGPSFARSKTTFSSTSAQVGLAARRPFAMSLARQDDRMMFEGGNSLPIGQEESLRAFFEAYRQLPSVALEPLALEDAAPLVLRMGTAGDETIAYAVNPSPWPVQASLQWEANKDCRISVSGTDEYETSRAFELIDTAVTIEPFGLVTFRCDQPDVRLTGCHSDLPAGVAKQLLLQLEEVNSRADQIEDPRPIGILRDPGFESSVGSGADPPWTVTSSTDGMVSNDRQLQTEGASSLYLKAVSAPVAVTSHDFAAPDTGRLMISIQLRARKKMGAPVLLRLLSSDPGYQPTYRFQQDLSDEFLPVGVRFIDLPPDPNLRLRIRLEMVEPGEIWIDDVQLFDKWFVEDEQTELMRLVFSADNQKRNKDFASCYESLAGYWPRFLLRHVDPVELAVRPSDPVDRTTPPRMPGRSPKPDRWNWRKLVPRLPRLF